MNTELKIDDLKRQADELEVALNERYRNGAGTFLLRALLVLGVPAGVGAALYFGPGNVLTASFATAGIFFAMLLLAPKVGRRAPSAGSRAWEAEQTAYLLDNVISERESELVNADEDTSEEINRELVFLLEQQIKELEVAASGDDSPGVGSFGFKPYEGRSGMGSFA